MGARKRRYLPRGTKGDQVGRGYGRYGGESVLRGEDEDAARARGGARPKSEESLCESGTREAWGGSERR